MLAIKAICKSENNEEVVIIGFELEGYCLCMTKSGTIFHTKHEDLTIVDKEYMKSCEKESIDFEMAGFLEKASAKLDQIQSKQLTSITLELQEYQDKIEQGTMIELPCKVGDTVYLVHRIDKEAVIENGCVTGMNIDESGLWVYMRLENGRSHCIHSKSKGLCFSWEEAENRLKEL
jgi:hypothetical protein